MMETILSWVLSAVGEGLEAMMDYLFGLLKLSLSSIIGYFPFLVGAYQVLQACALGLILAIAGWNLVKFFGGKVGKCPRYAYSNSDSRRYCGGAGV